MDRLHPELRKLIEVALAEGIGMDDIEEQLLDPAQLPRDERDALWLYAFGRSDYPHRRTVPLVSG